MTKETQAVSCGNAQGCDTALSVVQAAPIGAVINDLDTFAASMDQWHGAKMEEGNRLLELGVLNDASIEIEDRTNPGTPRTLELTGDVGAAFRVGVQSVLLLFQNLPFGVSVEEVPVVTDAGE